MRMLLLLSVVLVSSSALAEIVGSRYYRRGASVDYNAGYRAQQYYHTASKYDGANANGQGVYQNQWDVGRRYQLNHGAPVVAGGQMGTQGAAVRTYNHQNDPALIQQMERREAAIQAEHRYYVDTTQRSYKSTAESQMDLAKLARNPQPWARTHESISQNIINTNNTLERIEARMHSRAISGK